MRRSRISQLNPVSCRTGVTASVISSMLSPVFPMLCSSSCTGFGPRLVEPMPNALIAAQASGTRHAQNTSTLIPWSCRLFIGHHSLRNVFRVRHVS